MATRSKPCILVLYDQNDVIENVTHGIISIKQDCLTKGGLLCRVNFSPNNPYQPPDTSSQSAVHAVQPAWRWGTIVAGNLLLIPIYMIVLIASVDELVEVNNIMSRDAANYWRHAIAALISLSNCVFTLFLIRWRSSSAWYSFFASSLFLIVMIYPGLNSVWNVIADLIR
jgi:hypothetical protein